MAQEFKHNLEEYIKSPPLRSNYTEKALVSLNGSRRNYEEPEWERNDWLRNRKVPLLLCTETGIEEACTLIAELYSTYKQWRDVMPRIVFIDARQSVKEVISKLFLGPPSAPSREIKLLGSINTPRYSRYKSDYKELGILGRGGFGTVYKVKSAYDNALYAIKKIKLRNVDSKLTENIFSEVRLWAKFVHHPNIVTYHDVWHEECNFEEEKPFTTGKFRTPQQHPKITEITNEEELENFKSQGDNSNILIDIPDTPVTRKYSSESDDAGSFASLSDEENNDGQVAGKFWKRNCSTDSETLENIEFSQSAISASGPLVEKQLEKQRRNSSVGVDSIRKNIIIFIKMELCKETLEEYLIQRNAKWKINPNFPIVDGEFNLDLYMQLLSALQYIHHNHGIHRDIKPGNIFLKPDGRKYRVLLGDFGLACMESNDVKIGSDQEREPQDKPTLRTRQNSVHSIGVGTTTYAAPEQLQSSDYGPAVDLYSAGIVFFELYNNFSTTMERLKAIKNLRTERQVTPYMQEKWSAMVPDIIAMTDPCPLNRPSAAQLLTRFKADENEAISKYSDIIRGQKEENSVLKKVVRNQKEEIIVLKKKLAEFEAGKDKKAKRGN